MNNMVFKRKLPIPKDIKEMFPITDDLRRIKENRDQEVKDILSGKSDKFMLIIGPCSADNETAVLDYINRLKIARAKYLLEVTSYTLERLAYESGFNDYSHFYRMFQRECGISPTQWRSRIKLQPSQG